MKNLSASATLTVLLLLAPCAFARQAAPAETDFALTNAREPAEDVLFGGQPDSGQLEAMARAGFRTVIDLRHEDEPRGLDEATLLTELGLQYETLPVGSDTLQEPATFERFFKLFREAERPVLVHCGSGNRVGAMYYAYLVVEQGLERDEALEQARGAGLRSDALAEVVNLYLDARQP